MDWATLVGIHHLKTVMIKVIRVSQEDIKKKDGQKDLAEDPRQGSLNGRTVVTPDTSPGEKKDQPRMGSSGGP